MLEGDEGAGVRPELEAVDMKAVPFDPIASPKLGGRVQDNAAATAARVRV